MHCYYLKWSHIIPWTEQSLQYFIGWACQGKVLEWSVKLQLPTYKTGGAKQGSAQRRPATTSFKEIWSELRTRI